MSFCHLHVHSDASLLDGMSKVKDIAKKAKKLGQPAVALTDHGNIYNAIAFYQACKKEDVKPILGCEFYFVPSIKRMKEEKNRTAYHLTVLAENNKGWSNIVRMISASNHPDNFYHKPRIDYDILEQHSDGLIVLTGCMGGMISKSLMNDDQDQAIDFVKRMRDMFGNRLYFETQNAGLEEQDSLNEAIRALAKEVGRPTVATVDSHYVNREDAMTHIELKTISTGRDFVMSGGFGVSSEFFFKAREEVQLPDKEKDMTLDIAERCNVTIDLKKQRFPSYRPREGEMDGIDTHDILLRKKLTDGWQQRLTKEQRADVTYTMRAQQEFKEIAAAGFVDYFLIVADIVNWAKDNGIWVGPSRGSVAGSLLAYLLNITDVDPIKHGLIFERFYNSGRSHSAPDIDTDIELRYRKDVIRYIGERFGYDQVAQLMTLNTMAARAALKDVMRVNNVDFETANEITSLIPLKNDEHGTITLKEAIEKNDRLKTYSENPEYEMCFKHAKAIEGVAKSVGTHAAAVIISDKPFSDGELPLVRSPDGQNLMCGWPMKTIDALNILKCDILGLATLEVLHRCCDFIKERHNVVIDFDNLDYGDDKTYGLICRGLLDGVFQIETHLGKKWSKLLMPTSLSDIADLLALIRPGCLDTNMTDEYRLIKHGEKQAAYIHPFLKPILEPTHSVLIFQEQILEICKKIANMTLKEGDEIRRCLGKKLPDEMRSWKDKFITKAVEHTDMRLDDVESIWSWIEAFAGYGFNRSHALGYAIIAYRTAYLKAHYPLEFICACLICSKYNQKSLDEVKRFVNDAKLFGIRILPPDICAKNVDFSIADDNTIRFGLSHIKNLGESAIGKILDSNEAGDDFYQYIMNCPLNKRAVLALMHSGALDCFEIPRDRMVNEYTLYKKLSPIQQKNLKSVFKKGEDSVISITRKMSSEDEVDNWKSVGVRPPNVNGRKKLRKLVSEYEGMEILSDAQMAEKEREILGIATVPRMIPAKSKDTCLSVKMHLPPGTDNVKISGFVSDVKIVRTKQRGDQMAFIALEDSTYALDGIVVFPKLFNRVSSLLKVDRLINISGVLDNHGTLLCRKIEA